MSLLKTNLLILLLVGFIGCNKDSAVQNKSSSQSEIKQKNEQSENSKPKVSNKGIEVELLPEDGDLRKQIKKEINKLKGKDLKTFVRTQLSFSRACMALDKYVNDPLMQDAYRGTLIIRVDVVEWGSKENEKLAIDSGIELNSAPVFYEVDQEGKATGRKINSSVWGEDIPKNMAPPLKEFFNDG